MEIDPDEITTMRRVDDLAASLTNSSAPRLEGVPCPGAHLVVQLRPTTRALSLHFIESLVDGVTSGIGFATRQLLAAGDGWVDLGSLAAECGDRTGALFVVPGLSAC